MLERVLEALGAIDLGGVATGGVDLVVVDNNPTGEARVVCDRVREQLPIRLHFAEEEQRGIAFARNRAVLEAMKLGSDFVAFLDDDDVPRPDWLRRLLERQRETNADLVCGVWHWDVDADSSAWVARSPMFKTPKLNKRKRGIPAWMATCNVLVSRRVIEGLGAGGPVFSTEFGFLGCDDTDFFIRAHRSGAQIAIAERSVIDRYWQDMRLTLRGMLRHGFRYGNSAVHIARKHESRSAMRRLKRKAAKKLTRGVVLFPLSLTSRSQITRRLYEVSYGLGMVYAFSGRQFEFYR